MLLVHRATTIYYTTIITTRSTATLHAVAIIAAEVTFVTNVTKTTTTPTKAIITAALMTMQPIFTLITIPVATTCY